MLDAAHDTFTELIKDFVNGKTPHDPDALGSYLRTIAARRAMRHMRAGAPGKGHKPTMDALGIAHDVSDTRVDAAADEDDQWRAVDRKLGWQRVLQMVENEVVPTLKPEDQQVYEKVVQRGLAGEALGQSLGVTSKQARDHASKVRELVATGFIALVLFRAAREGRHHCPGLDRIIDASIAQSGEVFTEQARGNITRHVVTHDGLDKCSSCAPEARRLRVAWAPVLIPVLVVAELRDRVLETIRIVCAEGAAPPPGGHDDAQRPRRTGRLAGVLALIVLLLIGSAIIYRQELVKSPISGVALPVNTEGGKATGSVTFSIKHTPALLGYPDVPVNARRMSHEMDITVEPARVAWGSTVTVTEKHTGKLPRTRYLPGGGITCEDRYFGEPGSSEEIYLHWNMGGWPAGMTVPEGKTVLSFYRLPRQPSSTPPSQGPRHALIGDTINNPSRSSVVSDDGCMETFLGADKSRFVIPADGSIPAGRYLVTTRIPRFNEIEGVGGVQLSPEEVDGRIQGQLPVITVF